MNKFFYILISCLLSLSAIAQINNPNWKYLRTTNTGIGGDYSFVTEADHCGNIWTGGYLPFHAQGSLVRFNDTTWTNWSNFEGFIPGSIVTAIAFDSQDGVWVGCDENQNFGLHGGVAHYDGTTWQMWNSTNSPLTNDYVDGIVVDHNDHVWITFYNNQTGDGGVAKYDGTTWTVYSMANSNLPSEEVKDIDVDAQNNIWIGCNLGLIKFDGINWILYTAANSGLSVNNGVLDVEVDEVTNKVYAVTVFSVDVFDNGTWTHINNTNSPVGNANLAEVDAHGDTIIIGSLNSSSGAFIYDGTSWTTHLAPGHVYDVRIGANGKYWICGIGFLEKYDGINWTTYDKFNTGLPAMQNHDVFIDSKNRAWVGSALNGGISMFDCPQWQSYGPNNRNHFPQPINYTGSGMGATEDSYGDIWMLYDGSPGGVVQIPNGDVQNSAAWVVWDNVSAGIPLGFAARICADKSGNVWVGSSLGTTLARYSHATNSWTNNFNISQIGGVMEINSIRVDDSNNVWVCGAMGLAKFDQTNWTFYTSFNSPLQAGFVNDIAFDSLGNKWIATEHGLYKFDNTTWTLFDHTNTPMFGDWVNSIVFDANGLLYIHAEDAIFPGVPQGLLSFDGTTWLTYTTTNSGLPEQLVRRLSADTLGNIWITTQGMGIAIFNPTGVVGYDCLNKRLQLCSTPTALNENNAANEMNMVVYPNPFSTTTTLNFNLNVNCKINLTISDIQGRTVKTFYSPELQKGNNQLQLDLSGLNAGIYFCNLYAKNHFQTVKIIKY
ncbi:MAG: T9SS type A sorting domain-containing protein [Bacteroidia bacterium]|nr:T9SS type A sorting domain-containing protein [Bacteroidia bacterium]